MANIINIDNNKTKQVLYTKEQNFVDNVTGEVISQENTFLKKEKKKDDFIKLFVDNIVFWVSLDNKEKNLLFCALSEMNWLNIIKLDSSFRKISMHYCDASRNTIATALNSLIEKKIFIKLTREEYFNLGKSVIGEAFQNVYFGNEYLINPQIVGKGSFRDIKSMRQTIVKDFDFETLEMKQQIIQEVKHIDFDEVSNNLDKHEIKQINQNSSSDGKIKNTEIVIGEKDFQEHVNVEVVSENQNKIEKNGNEKEDDKDKKILQLELEMSKLKEEKLEVLLAQKDAEIEKLKALNELKMYKKAEEKSLFDDETFLPNKNDKIF